MNFKDVINVIMVILFLAGGTTATIYFWGGTSEKEEELIKELTLEADSRKNKKFQSKRVIYYHTWSPEEKRAVFTDYLKQMHKTIRLKEENQVRLNLLEEKSLSDSGQSIEELLGERATPDPVDVDDRYERFVQELKEKNPLISAEKLSAIKTQLENKMAQEKSQKWLQAKRPHLEEIDIAPYVNFAQFIQTKDFEAISPKKIAIFSAPQTFLSRKMFFLVKGFVDTKVLNEMPYFFLLLKKNDQTIELNRLVRCAFDANQQFWLSLVKKIHQFSVAESSPVGLVQEALDKEKISCDSNIEVKGANLLLDSQVRPFESYLPILFLNGVPLISKQTYSNSNLILHYLFVISAILERANL